MLVSSPPAIPFFSTDSFARIIENTKSQTASGTADILMVVVLSVLRNFYWDRDIFVYGKVTVETDVYFVNLSFSGFAGNFSAFGSYGTLGMIKTSYFKKIRRIMRSLQIKEVLEQSWL